ncbi:MAG: NfeD family protein [Firmicutes bacterium]|nr:NfeD family protein [Bacillota bacterium]
MEFIWLILLVIFLIIEAACPIHLVSIWFAVGAVVAMLVQALGGQAWLQCVLFVAVSGALLAAFWPMSRKLINARLTATNVDSVIGSEGYVIAAVDNLAAVGTVKLGAMEWTARSTSGAPIPEGTLVKVDRIEGVKAFVTPVEVTTQV